MITNIVLSPHDVAVTIHSVLFTEIFFISIRSGLGRAEIRTHHALQKVQM